MHAVPRTGTIWMGRLLLVGALLLSIRYGSYLQTSTDVRGGVRGSVLMLIRPERHGLRFIEVKLFRDGTVAAVQFAPESSTLLALPSGMDILPQEVAAIRAWCVQAPPPAVNLERTNYVVGLACRNAEVRMFTMTAADVPPAIQQVFHAAQTATAAQP